MSPSAQIGYVRTERTRRMPTPSERSGLPFAPVARATVDACRHLESLSAVRELAAGAVQEELCDVHDLAAEVHAAARQRTAPARHVLHDVSEGVRSVAEAKAQEILARHDLPQPLWNATLLGSDGEPLLTPDAFWPEFSAALEIDSKAWHLRPKDWDKTRRRQRRMTIGGVTVIAFSPLEIIDDPAAFAHDVAAFLVSVGKRDLPPGMTFNRAA